MPRLRQPRSFARIVGRVLLGWALTALSASRAYADDPADRASQAFRTGNDLYNEGKFTDALVAYDAAYAASRNPKVLYNRGQCLVMLRREPQAIESFERYLRDGGDKIPDDRRKTVEADLLKLRERLGTIRIEGAPDGSEVVIDGEVVARTPVDHPILAGMGKHLLSVRPPGGGLPFVGQIEVIAGTEKVQTVSFASRASVPPSDAAGPPVPPAPNLPPPVPKLPPRRPGGLSESPAFALTLHLGVAVPATDYKLATTRGLGSVELGAGWRPNSFWELGAFFGLASGTYSLQPQAIAAERALGTEVEPNAKYAFSTYGVRGRVHAIREKQFDGWAGVDVGGWAEEWSVAGSQNFKFRAKSPMFALGVGVDVPLSRVWAIGGLAQYISANGEAGQREECAAAVCNGKRPGEGTSGGSGVRGYFEVAARLVMLLPL